MSIRPFGSSGSAYQAGVCNIDSREVARRRRFGIAGVAGAVLLALVLLAAGVPPIARALVLLPLWGGLVSLEQARRRFCVAFGYAGLRSAEGSDRTEAVGDPADIAADRATARRMVAYCGAIAAAITACLVSLPA